MNFRVSTALPRGAGSSRAGSALVIVLGLLSVLLLMGVSFAVTMRTERSGASNMRHAALARHVLDSALARTMADLDVELRSYEEGGRFYGNAIPDDMVVLSSYDEDADSISILSHELARHLPSDQLACALYTQASWKPIFGGVSISDRSDTDPTSEDPPVGRYAYVVINGCGCLDPNVVGGESRGVGLSTSEIQLGRTDGDKLLDVKDNGTVKQFLSRRNSDGHYASMRDFLNEEVGKVVKNPAIKPKQGKFAISTNCFAIGSMAVDDPTPPVEVDNAKLSTVDGDPDTATPYRLPKCSLVDEKGKLLDPGSIDKDKAMEIAEAFRGAFYSTRTVGRGDDKIPTYYSCGGYTAKNEVYYEYLVTRILLDAMDDDVIPGGSTKHSLSHIGTSNSDAKDEYLSLFKNGCYWDCFPCTEPVPMLDNLIFIGGTTTKKGLEYNSEKSKQYRQVYDDGQGGKTYGAYTGAVWTVTFSVFNSSVYYPGWNVPKAAEGEYKFHWIIPSIEYKGTSDDRKFKAFDEAMKKLESEDMLSTHETTGTFKLKAGNGRAPADRRPDLTGSDFLCEVASFDVVMTWNPNGTDKPDRPDASDWIPELFGFSIHAAGYVTVGNDNNNVVQMAPCWRNTKGGGEPSGTDVLDLDLVISSDHMMKSDCDGTDDHLLGGIYCIDPMFAFNKDSWIPSLLFEEAVNGGNGDIREFDLTSPSMDAEFIANMIGGGLNPLANIYISEPYRKYGGSTLFTLLANGKLSPGGDSSIVGGCSDVMWANPNVDFSKSEADNPDDASYAFYFDPDEDEDSPYYFNRVGQMGFLPIGTYRTIALLDGFSQNDGGTLVRTPRQRVLDYFTMHAPREEGTEGRNDDSPGEPHKAALFQSKLNINPPRTVRWVTKADGGTTKFELETDEYNLLPMTAALTGCPLREWGATDVKRMPIDWAMARELAEAFAENLDRDDNDARTEDVVKYWNSDGVAHDISVLGRCGQPLSSPDKDDLKDDPSWDSILREKTKADCDFDREGIVRNSSEMFTARQQLFTILLKADSFTPKFGFNDASHGTSLASVQAIAHVWRDPDPLRDASGRPIRDKDGNAIHPWVLLDISQF